MVVPFNNRVESFDILGQYIWDALEISANEINDESTNLKQFLQISGKFFFLIVTQSVELKS